MRHCSPARQGLVGSCLTTAELQSVAALYNQEEEEAHKSIPMEAFKSRDRLIHELKTKFQPVCPDMKETCWLEKAVKSRDLYNLLTTAYRPKKPSTWTKNKREWLNTYDILNVMKQYEEKHDTFEFLGVFPVDFAEKHKTQTQAQQHSQTQTQHQQCIVQQMCNFSIKQLLSKSKTSFGIIMNLDAHDMPGSHWVACYCCLDESSPKYGICYFDSGGDPPPKPISDFMKSIYTQVNKPGVFQKRYNPTQMQFKNTECGIFSILFVTLCLKHKRLNYAQTRQKIKPDPKDNWAHNYRDHFYRDV